MKKLQIVEELQKHEKCVLLKCDICGDESKLPDEDCWELDDGQRVYTCLSINTLQNYELDEQHADLCPKCINKILDDIRKILHS